jgi:hypothetical protein
MWNSTWTITPSGSFAHVWQTRRSAQSQLRKLCDGTDSVALNCCLATLHSATLVGVEVHIFLDCNQRPILNAM